MKIIAQLPGVNRPLSVELRLINFCSCYFDSQEENHTALGQLLLTKRSDFHSAEGLVRVNPFGGVEFGKPPRRYRRFVKERERWSKTPDSAVTKEYLVGTKRSEDRYSWTSPRRFATVIASVRLRTFSFVKMLRKCPFTVVSLMKRFAPISLLLLPRASNVNTPSSRPVRVSLLMPAASFSTRACGMQVSPRPTFRIQSSSSSRRASFNRYPFAPALIA